MSHQTIARQRPLFHDGPDWQQLNSDVRKQLVEHLALLCLEIVNTPNPLEKDQEQRDDFGN